MKNCIIHPRFVYDEGINPANTQRKRNLALQAHYDISALLRDDPSVFVLETGNPASVADHYKTGDEVMLYGAYRDGCMEIARKALETKGVNAEFHPTGSIPMFLED